MARKKPKTVEISEEYLTFLHDQLAVNQSKLKEFLNDSGAQVVTDASSDELAGLISKERGVISEDALVDKIEGWGMQVKKNRRGSLVEFDVSCPYAEIVHPKLTAEKPVCPLGEYVLGVVRSGDSGAQLRHNHLKEDGARFSIETSQK